MFDNLKAKLTGCWRSVTIWFNGIMALLIAVLPMWQEALPQLQQYLPANVYQHLSIALVITNILLRFKTAVPLEAK